MKVYVLTQQDHWDGIEDVWRREGERYVCDQVIAERRERHDLVIIGDPVDDVEDQAFDPGGETQVPAETVESKEATSPEDLITSRDGGWYDVEGHDDNPVQGFSEALSIAEELFHQ